MILKSDSLPLPYLNLQTQSYFLPLYKTVNSDNLPFRNSQTNHHVDCYPQQIRVAPHLQSSRVCPPLSIYVAASPVHATIAPNSSTLVSCSHPTRHSQLSPLPLEEPVIYKMSRNSATSLLKSSIAVSHLIQSKS